MCPVCNKAYTLKWIAKREAELLPVGYFLLTFTIPKELRPLFLCNKNLCYNLLFKSISKVLKKGVKIGKFCGQAGFFSILHTWDQRLNFHPHIHVVIPSGCLSLDKTKWNSSYLSFFLPVKKLSLDFREKLLFYLMKENKAKKLNIPET